MKIRQRFTFTLQAASPVHFGGGTPGELLLDGNDAPFASGNSIGGALRSFLGQGERVEPEDIQYYMGKGGSSSEEEFIESRMFISDGTISGMEKLPGRTAGHDAFPAMEGTAIDPASGAARRNHKYKRYFLPAGIELSFTVECDTDGGETEKRLPFSRLVYIWAEAIEKGELRFGGQKSNGYGRFTVRQLTCSEFVFDSPEALDQYIFGRHSAVAKDCREEALKSALLDPRPDVAVLSLKGCFPYAVYQAYQDQKLSGKGEVPSKVTGLMRNEKGDYYLPGSSIKGVLRHELWCLLLRMLQDRGEEDAESERLANIRIQKWFGGPDQAGAIVVGDVIIQKAQEMKLPRAESQGEFDLPKYTRIDRITGGVIDGALKTHNEVRGEAELRLELRAAADMEAKLFPLVYLLRRIGSGFIPLGGRTVIGLGEFKAAVTCVNLNGQPLEFDNEKLNERQEQLLRQFYDRFVEFVNKGGTVHDDSAGI
ncbi:RAMP superfamily CRISPR-associated protein [Paenibacillus sp. YN15]|uniref:RAMP superfamily CRISPR-associated protein n=1 Tax=Paenibacillus sp. YN15 TaxID=1742774 RepID=UPI000DCE58C3|nr:RAMP superfamily CRISPR-associated protein [Paenibacillus sp. YN15]RAU94352.1 hypothetical protein DQG13_24190 [Paenibacillus sp. YN15]